MAIAEAGVSLAVHFSSASVEHSTPQVFYDKLHAEFNFTLDPCASHENHKCSRYFTKEDDGLSISWIRERAFVNPPYGRAIGEWMRKALLESVNNEALCVCLVPARTDTKWWWNYVEHHAEVRRIPGRLKFGDGKSGAPFPSALVIYHPVI